MRRLLDIQYIKKKHTLFLGRHLWSGLTSIIQVLKWQQATKNKEDLDCFGLLLISTGCLFQLILKSTQCMSVFSFSPDPSSDTLPLLTLERVQ